MHSVAVLEIFFSHEMFLRLVLRHRQCKKLGKPSWDVTCQLVALMCFVLPHMHDTLNKEH